MKSERTPRDQRPGAVPEIYADGDSVTFCLDMPPERARLLIRCKPDGTVGVSIDLRQGTENERAGPETP